jgi:hypothetical protein
LPVPLLPLVTVSHTAEDVDDQVHVAPVATPTRPVDAAAATETPVGASVTSQVPAWLTLTVFPATVSDPVRAAAVALAATWKVTAPLPEVLGPAPLVTEIHAGELLAAVQEQPAGIVTDTLRVPPELSNDSVVDDTVDVQVAASCVTFRSLPPMAIVPLRAVPFGLAVTR